MFRLVVAPLALVLALLLPWSPPAGAADTLEKIMKDKTFNIGYIAVPPAVIRDPKTSELTGYFVDSIRLICEQMGVKPNFIEASWSTFIAGLQSGQFDLSIATTFATIPRATAVDFTRPIQYNAYSAIARKGDTRFKTLADIDQPGIKVALVQGAAGHEYAKQNFKNAQLIVLATADLTAPFVEVSAKRADVGIEDSWSTRRYAAQHPEVVDLFADRPYNVLPISWAVRKGEPELLNFINTAIDYLRVNGRLEQFAAKYGPSSFFLVRQQYAPLVPNPH
jgi:ABC-type amino acid transport substrate-binding protein